MVRSPCARTLARRCHKPGISLRLPAPSQPREGQQPDENAALLELEEYMSRYDEGQTLQRFGLPEPTARASQPTNRALSDLLLLNSRDMHAYVEEHEPLLNDGQRAAFEAVMDALDNDQVRAHTPGASVSPSSAKACCHKASRSAAAAAASMTSGLAAAAAAAELLESPAALPEGPAELPAVPAALPECPAELPEGPAALPAGTRCCCWKPSITWPWCCSKCLPASSRIALAAVGR